MAESSRLPIQNTNNRRLCIWKNRCIIEFNKQSTRYLYANEDIYTKNPYEAKYDFLIDKRQNIRLKHFNDLKAFIEYSNDMQDVYQILKNTI